MAGLAVHPRRNVRPVVEIYEVWQDEHRCPLYRFLVLYEIYQFIQLSIAQGNLLVASPALGFRGQASGYALPCPGVAVEALNAEPQVQRMWELDWLRRRLLAPPDTKDSPTNNNHKYDAHRC